MLSVHDRIRNQMFVKKSYKYKLEFSYPKKQKVTIEYHFFMITKK